MTTTLLLVEDENSIAVPLIEVLAGDGYKVVRAASFKEAQVLCTPDIQLVILDWMLPDGQGIDLLKSWRQAGLTLPIIFLTARHDLIDRVVGLEMGADDYVSKPFETRELLARIKARLRSAPGRDAAPAASVDLSCGGIVMRVAARDVTYNGKHVSLTKMEFGLLQLFMENVNRVFTRDELLNKVWGLESYPTTRTIDTHVLQLRQHFAAELFETVRGVGYRLKS